MLLRQEKKKTLYKRKSKNGEEHPYYRNKTIVYFLCDNCGTEFTRDRGDMNPRRLSNNYFHVCANCDSKKFAQRKRVERKKVWSMNASSDLPISRL